MAWSPGSARSSGARPRQQSGWHSTAREAPTTSPSSRKELEKQQRLLVLIREGKEAIKNLEQESLQALTSGASATSSLLQATLGAQRRAASLSAVLRNPAGGDAFKAAQLWGLTFKKLASSAEDLTWNARLRTKELKAQLVLSKAARDKAVRAVQLEKKRGIFGADVAAMRRVENRLATVRNQRAKQLLLLVRGTRTVLQEQAKLQAKLATQRGRREAAKESLQAAQKELAARKQISAEIRQIVCTARAFATDSRRRETGPRRGSARGDPGHSGRDGSAPFEDSSGCYIRHRRTRVAPPAPTAGDATRSHQTAR